MTPIIKLSEKTNKQANKDSGWLSLFKIHISHTKSTVLDLYNVCTLATMHLNYSRQQESKNNLQFMILTYL